MTSATPYGKTIQHRRLFKGSTDRKRCQEQYLSWLVASALPSVSLSGHSSLRALSAPPPYHEVVQKPIPGRVKAFLLCIVLTLIYMGFWLHRDIWGGAESARSKRMASEVNWGHWGYHQGQILFLTSFPICRTLEQPPVLHTLAVMDCQSHQVIQVSLRKIINVSVSEIPNFANFWAI